MKIEIVGPNSASKKFSKLGTDRISMRATNNNMSALTSTLYRKRTRRYHETQLLSTKYIGCLLDPNTEERVSRAMLGTRHDITSPQTKIESYLFVDLLHARHVSIRVHPVLLLSPADSTTSPAAYRKMRLVYPTVRVQLRL